jgi:hypothetical protein
MRISKRDIAATVLVVVSGILYLLWAIDRAVPGMNSVRATGVAVLGLGFAASAIAVVPGFTDLLHGNKLYLALTSMVGIAGLVAGIALLVTGNGVGLGVLMLCMGVLWVAATLHHVATAPSASQPVARRTGRIRPPQ